jgi:hypothetical protein
MLNKVHLLRRVNFASTRPMKTFILFILLSTAFVPVSAELLITSLDYAGALTWTNSASNATYRLEWASSPSGPWNRMEALTNISSVQASNTVTTVKIPMVYRVVWTDAPPLDPKGVYDYRGYDQLGTLVATGRVVITSSTNPLTGTWLFNRVTSNVHPVGSSSFRGSISNNIVDLDLDPSALDSDFRLRGQLNGNTVSGTWSIERGWDGSEDHGPFIATK